MTLLLLFHEPPAPPATGVILATMYAGTKYGILNNTKHTASNTNSEPEILHNTKLKQKYNTKQKQYTQIKEHTYG